MFIRILYSPYSSNMLIFCAPRITFIKATSHYLFRRYAFIPSYIFPFKRITMPLGFLVVLRLSRRTLDFIMVCLRLLFPFIVDILRLIISFVNCILRWIFSFLDNLRGIFSYVRLTAFQRTPPPERSTQYTKT